MSYARGFPIDRGKMRVVNLLWRAAVGDRGMQREAILKYGGFRMICDLDETLQRQFYFFGTYFIDRKLLECFASVAQQADCVFDVGANVGIFSLAAAASGRPTIYAFEPTSEIAQRLRETAARNGIHGLKVHQMAVTEKSGTATLVRYRGPDDSNGGMNFISEIVTESSETVPTVSLDDFCRTEAIGRVDVLKMDIQGNEHLALAGARELLTTGRIGTIFTELNWSPPGQQFCAATEVIRLLDASGYKFSEPAAELRWRQPGDWMRGLTDVVARR